MNHDVSGKWKINFIVSTKNDKSLSEHDNQWWNVFITIYVQQDEVCNNSPKNKTKTYKTR